jgi:Lar family restriction alleviation protein
MQKPIELLPCPFCGGVAELDTRQYYRTIKGEMDDRVCVYCTTCNADMGIGKKDVPDVQPEHVIDLWNTRASDQFEEDMVLMIGRLIYKLRKASPDDDLPAKALDFLKRNDITIRPLCR